MTRRDRWAGLIGAADLVWGAVLLLRGERLWRMLAHDNPQRVDGIAIRVLGAREVVQGAAQLAAPKVGRRTAVTVEVLHAVSMVALALRDRRRRGPATVSAVVATVTACALAAGAHDQDADLDDLPNLDDLNGRARIHA